MPVPSRAGSGWWTSRGFCVSLATVWPLLGAGLCAVLFAVSLVPEQGPDIRSVPRGLNDACGVLEACMLPLCTLIPVPLLIAGRRFLRRSLAGTRRLAVWTAVASAGIAVEAVFWLRVYLFMSGPRWLSPHSWHALELSAGFLIVGVAMAWVLLGAVEHRDRLCLTELPPSRSRPRSRCWLPDWRRAGRPAGQPARLSAPY